MKNKYIYLGVLLASLMFLGCSSDSSSPDKTKTLAKDIADTPQPAVDNEALQPPRPPSL